jgi:outer membrane protein assembly factor BamB
MRIVRRAFEVACVLLGVGSAAAIAQTVPEESVRRPGRALLSVYYTGSPQPTGVYLRSDDGSVRQVWSGRPYDVLALPDRSTVVCERAEGRVVWLDPQGVVLFEKTGLRDPVDVEVTDGGNTLVVVQEKAGNVVGIDRATGAIRWTREGFFNHYDVELLPDGGLIVADSGHGRVVWLDAAGRVVRTKELPYPNTVTHLPNGNTLVTTYNHRQVVEVDAKNEVVWRAQVPGSGSVFRAARRKDGNTVVVVGEVGAREVGRILVLDPRGQVLHEEQFPAGGVVDFEPIDEL